MTNQVSAANIDRERLREQVASKYTDVASAPEKGFHFHTGRPLAKMLGYEDADLDWLPKSTLESFAGTGNPLSMGRLNPGEVVVDLGCGAGVDALLAARQVGPKGRVIAVDMTAAMLAKTRIGALALGLGNVDARFGYAEALPVESGSVDILISNGVINLCPDKVAVMQEVRRVLKPGGRIQVGDIVVHKEVPQDAREDIDLWAG
ncbi:MAG: methyltransferase domain-containing protein [Deltaproteobacteria bacterium]|nr:methyltransferase domain-containing protein [Deltaproteobacteria bacterium]